MNKSGQSGISRRMFMPTVGGLGVALGVAGVAGRAKAIDLPTDADGKVISGFENTEKGVSYWGTGWKPVSDRKIKVGIAGYGLCKFGATWFYQNHPNVEVVAATDLDPVR